MVTALQGVLLTCDIPLKEIIKAFNDAQDPPDKFIIADLKEGLFIRADKLQFVQTKVKEHTNSLHYQHATERAGVQ